MKKFIATIFLLIYFVTSSGATIQLHYCMDRLVSWSVLSKENSKCGKCGMEFKGHSGCCHDESKPIKIEKTYKGASIYIALQKIVPLVIKNSNASTVYILVVDPLVSFSSTHAPPRTRTIPIYLSNSVFRI